jgi:yjeF N-terminal region
MDRDDWQFPWGHGWPEIDRAGMVEVDRRMIATHGIALEKMMENAGRALAIVAWRRWLARAEAPRVTVLAGSGGNGGGVLVAARRLAAWGARVDVVLTRPAKALAPVPAAQLASLETMGVPVLNTPGDGADLILDGMVGYSLSGAPKGHLADLIVWANGSGMPILALDVPSGFDAATGLIASPAISATATVTLALPKRGVTEAAVRWAVGDLYLADISVPPALYATMACPTMPPHFRGEDILRIA